MILRFNIIFPFTGNNFLKQLTNNAIDILHQVSVKLISFTSLFNK